MATHSLQQRVGVCQVAPLKAVQFLILRLPVHVGFTLHFLPAGSDVVPVWVQHLLGGVRRRCYDVLPV